LVLGKTGTRKSKSEFARDEIARKSKGGKARAEEKVLGSGPLVLGKEKAGNEFSRS